MARCKFYTISQCRHCFLQYLCCWSCGWRWSCCCCPLCVHLELSGAEMCCVVMLCFFGFGFIYFDCFSHTHTHTSSSRRFFFFSVCGSCLFIDIREAPKLIHTPHLVIFGEFESGEEVTAFKHHPVFASPSKPFQVNLIYATLTPCEVEIQQLQHPFL